jgi:glycosyltransferase involved in cell wall biosynthesis
VLVRGVRALRAAGGLDHAATEEVDARIGEHLLSRRSVAERDAVGRQLWAEEVPAAEVDAVESTLHALRRLPRRAWIADPELGEEQLEADVRLDAEPLRVCMLLHKPVDNDARVQREARALAAAGHEVAIVHLGPAGGGDYAEIRSASPRPSVRATLPFGLYRLAYLRNFVRRIRELKPDVVHAHDTAMLIPGLIGARLTGARLVYDSHEYAVGVAYHERAWALLVATVERLVIRRCAAVITVSRGIADELQQRYRLRSPPAVVRNFPDLESVTAASSESGVLRDSLGVDGVPLLLHQGAVVDGRGCETLVLAVAALDGSACDAHLVFLGAGDDAYARGLRGLADDSGLADRVHFLPPVPLDELLGYTADADVGVSLLEPTCANHSLALPNKVFEYVAAGLPIVVSALPEVESIVRRYDIGWTVDPTDAQDVSDGLAAALGARSDAELRGRVAAAARELNWRREQTVLIAVYEDLARPTG